MPNALSPPPKFQAIDASGNPVSGGLVYTYAAGTSTPVVTYSNSAGTTNNTNPVVLDAAGMATIYLVQGSSYKFVVKDANDVLLYTQDNIRVPAEALTDWVESVTGLNTNNVDPQNPVVRVSVDGSTITGLGTPGSPLAWIPQSAATLSTFAPFTTTSATYPVGAEDFQVIANRAGTVTLTLPTASTNTGRMLLIRTITANTVVSATSNVIPLDGGAASTAILPATDGAWAVLQSNGTNWLISEQSSSGGGGGGMAIGDPVTSGTAGSVLFVAAGPVLAQDNTNFKWDNTNKVLSIGVGCVIYGDTSANIYLSDQPPPSGLVGAGAAQNVAIGSLVLNALTNGYDVVALGDSAGATLTSGHEGTFCGAFADGTATGENQNSFGFGATCTANNQVTLGNSSIATLRCQQTSITALSDLRDKTNVKPLTLGVDFIDALQPISFFYTHERGGSPKPGQEAGFGAQHLQEASAKFGAEWLRLVDDSNPDKLEATPGRLFPVMVKAIQELSELNRALTARVGALEN